MKQETETLAGLMAFRNSATTNTNEVDKAAYEDTVNNFGTAFAANLTAFQNLSEVNHQMSENLASKINNLQNQVFHVTAMMQNMSANYTQPP